METPRPAGLAPVEARCRNRKRLVVLAGPSGNSEEGFGFWVLGSGFGSRVWGLGFRFLGFGLWVWDSGLVLGSGLQGLSA